MSSINSENVPLLNEDTQKSNYLAVPEEKEEENPLSIYNENDILFCVKEETRNDTVKDRIGHMLHTTKWNITILLMIACDVFIVVLELFVQLDDKKKCPACPINGGNPPINSFDMSEANHEKLANFVHHISFLSDIFLCVFTTEVFLHLYCFGFGYLFEAWINFVDSLTVITTFIVTIAITFYSASEEAQGLVDILIILRFWRVSFNIKFIIKLLLFYLFIIYIFYNIFKKTLLINIYIILYK